MKDDFSFDNFEFTWSNSKAFEKAKQFAKNADSKPLAIFGGTATGKTHLLYAVKNAIEQNSPDLHVILTTATDMASALTNIISNGGTEKHFREHHFSFRPVQSLSFFGWLSWDSKRKMIDAVPLIITNIR